MLIFALQLKFHVMKYLPILLILFVSCSPQKRIQRLTEKHPELIPVKEKVIKKDSTVFKEKIREVPVFIEGDTVRIETPIDCPDQEIILSENKTMKQTIRILNGKLQSTTEVKPDTVYIPVKDTETTNNSVSDVKQTVPVKYIPNLYKVALWVSIGLILALGVWLFIKIKL